MSTSPSGFLQIGTDPAEKYVRRDADGAGEAFSHLLAQRLLHLQGQLARDRHCRSVHISLQTISSIEHTFSTGRQVSTALKMRS
jgi:hypothetical protein